MQVLSNKPKLDATRLNLLSHAFDRVIKDFYKNPENERAFQKWKSKKENGDSVKSIQDYGANSNRDRAIEKQSLRQTRKESGE